MKNLVAILALTLFPLLGFGANHVVTMKSISFDPKVLEVKKGDSVEWTNKSYTEHSATSDDQTKPEKFDTGLVAPQKASKSIVFSVAGTYTYHCSIHGKSMSGRVVVSP